MTEIRFYHLTRSTIDQALPDLLEKTLSRGWRAHVRVATYERGQELSTHLWTYRKESFLPHGTVKDGQAELQPVWISDEDTNVNGARVLFILNGEGAAGAADYELACEVFDGNDTETVQLARGRWADYKVGGHQLTYWQQGEKGWTKKGE